MGTVNLVCAGLCSGFHGLHEYSQCGMCWLCGCVVDIMVYMSTVNVVCAGCVVDIMVYMSIVNVVCAGCVV